MKKSKLLLSLAMMCLSVAVLCFGVLAATSVTYSISGTISYEVNDVFVKINTSVYGIAEQQSKADVITTVKVMESVSQANSLTINSKTYTRTQTMVEYDSTNASGTTVTHTAQTSDNKGVEIVYGTYYTYYIVINIQNLSSSKTVDAMITDNTTAEINSIKTTNLYQNNIASTETKNIVIAYSIKDKTSSVDSAAISYSLKVSYDAYTDPVTFTNDVTNKGYFISLGTYSSSPTQWKLVSLDGVNRYDYTDGTDNLEARYLSGAVFIQNTYIGDHVYHNSADYVSYSNSSIRTYINTPSVFGLTAFPNYITSYTNGEGDSRVEGDKLWLMDLTEVNLLCGSSGEEGRIFKTSDDSSYYWWLRNAVNYDDGFEAYFITPDGECVRSYATGSRTVRTAFQLA